MHVRVRHCRTALQASVESIVYGSQLLDSDGNSLFTPHVRQQQTSQLENLFA